MKALLLPVLLLICSLCSAPAVATYVSWQEAGDEWLTRESEHFRIHYLRDYEDMALHAVNIAEQVHKELVPFFKQQPSEKTELVLTDDYDYSNGWATPWQYNQIRLYASPPEDVNGLEHMDEWLHGLIRHEYVHILHLDMRSEVPRIGSYIFGRFYLFFPHIYTPSLFKEGLAVYQETDKTLGYGRLDSSFYDMQMRMEVSGPGPDDLGQAVLTLDDWPSSKAYLYGSYFTQYLADQYGEEKISAYLNEYSDELIPYARQNSQARYIYGRDFTLLWSDFRSWLEQEYQPQLTALEADKTASRNLPEEPSYRMVMAADKERLLWVTNDGKDKPALVALTPGDTQPEVLTSAKNVTGMDVADDGTIALSRRIPYASGKAFNDIFLWQKEDGWQRLTERMRLRKVRWMPDGKHLLASRKQKGLSELFWLDRSGNTQLLWQGAEQWVLGGFDISADGRYLVASVKRPQQGWNLEWTQLPPQISEPLRAAEPGQTAELKWQLLTDTRATENAPVFTPDGKILFSADYDGIYNLYLLNPLNGQVQQLTNVVSGAFDPQWLNGSVAYQEYTRDGYQLKTVDTPQVQREFNIAEYQGRYDYPVFPPAGSEQQTTQSSYSPWRSLLPRFWLPWAEVDDNTSVLGAATSGTDALNRHYYYVAAGWDSENSWAEGTLIYTYDNRWYLGLQRSHSYDDLNLGTDDDYYAYREDLAVLSRSYLLRGFEDQLSLHAGLVYDDDKLILSPQLYPAQYHYRETLAGVALTFDNRESYTHVPGIGWGTYFDLVYESNDVLDSQYNGAQWQSRWQRTFDLPQRNTLQLTAIGGIADKGAGSFSLGGRSSEESSVFGRDQFSLPGYDSGVQIGHKYYRASLNYQWWLGSVQQNWNLWPVGLGDYYLNFRASRGSAWFRQQHRDALDSVAMEATIDVVLGYSLSVPLTLGVAHGLDEDAGKTQGYLSFVLSY